MNRDTDEYDRWENGCVNDPVRNDFLIPALVEEVELNKPKRILDVGTANGYLPRRIQLALSYSPEWTLLDKNRAAISHLKERVPAGMQAELVVDDVLAAEYLADYDAVFLTFTLLEERDRRQLFRRLADLMRSDGLLYVAVPDSLHDLLSEYRKRGDFSMLQSYLTELIALEKTDKFTGGQYPFLVERVASIIGHALAANLVLVGMTRKEVCERPVYLLVFKKEGENG